MATRRKLTLVNGAIDQEGSILMYRAENGFGVGACPSGRISVPPLPFPNDDDDWDNFEQTE